MKYNKLFWFKLFMEKVYHYFLIDYGPNLNTIWVIANCNDGKIRHYDSNDIVLKEMIL
jgi:hypothetical protein